MTHSEHNHVQMGGTLAHRDCKPSWDNALRQTLRHDVLYPLKLVVHQTSGKALDMELRRAPGGWGSGRQAVDLCYTALRGARARLVELRVAEDAVAVGIADAENALEGALAGRLQRFGRGVEQRRDWVQHCSLSVDDHLLDLRSAEWGPHVCSLRGRRDSAAAPLRACSKVRALHSKQASAS